jgi:hypothetical protein
VVRWAPGVHVLGWWRMEGLGVPLGLPPGLLLKALAVPGTSTEV